MSDHSLGFLAPIIAVSLGATIIEKHVTFNKNAKGPDHKASLTINEFSAMIKLVRSTEEILGKKEKILSKSEKQNALAVRKSCVSSKDIRKVRKLVKSLFVLKDLEQAFPFRILNL